MRTSKLLLPIFFVIVLAMIFSVACGDTSKSIPDGVPAEEVDPETPLFADGEAVALLLEYLRTRSQSKTNIFPCHVKFEYEEAVFKASYMDDGVWRVKGWDYHDKIYTWHVFEKTHTVLRVDAPREC